MKITGQIGRPIGTFSILIKSSRRCDAYGRVAYAAVDFDTDKASVVRFVAFAVASLCCR